MYNIALIAQVYFTQINWCTDSICKLVNVEISCRENYNKVENFPLLSPKITETYLTRTCYTYELNSNNNRTGRAKKEITRTKIQ